MKILRLFAIVLLLSLQCSSSARAEQVKPGNHKYSLTVGARKRNYFVHIPRHMRSEPMPVVIVLHGVITTAGNIAWDSEMSAKSERDSFIVVYPSGVGLSWNAGDCCGKGAKKQVDDVAFIRALILKVRAEFPVDPKKVFVTGISNGGMMAYRLGQEMPELIAAIAPVEGCMRDVDKPATEPLSVIIFNGTADTVIPYVGGTGNWYGFKIATKPVSDAVKYWVKADRCKEEPEREDCNSSIKDVYTNGANGSEVCLYTIKGCKHTWPGGKFAKVLHWHDSEAFCATDAMCDFFWAHPKL
jgi:polyhydroxybutyrate depolymerase